MDIPSNPDIAMFNFETGTLTNVDGTTVRIQVVDDIAGKGSFGKTYKVKNEVKSMEVVIKKLPKEGNSLENAIKEFLIQLIIEKDTENIADEDVEGPFVPRVAYFAIDDDNYYIVSEAMEKTVLQEMNYSKMTAGKLRSYIVQLSKILQHLYELEHFNHRDCKLDNLMIKNNKVRLIDFGISCFENKVDLQSERAHTFETCYRKDRDLKMIFFHLLKLYRVTRYPIINIIRILLGSDQVEDRPALLWAYQAYNTENLNPLMTPEIIYEVFKNMKLTDPESLTSPVDPTWGEPLNEQDANGDTILHKAAKDNNVDLLTRLLDIPALKTKILNNEGLTAYHVAASENTDKKIFDLFLKRNPTLANKKTPEGKKAHELATDPELQAYLKSKVPHWLLSKVTRNTDKKKIGGTKKDLKRRRRTTRRH